MPVESIYIQGKYIRDLEKRSQVVLDEGHDTGVLAFMHEKTSLNKMQHDSKIIPSECKQKPIDSLLSLIA